MRSEVHCSLSSVTLSGLAFRGSKKGFDEDDSEALWHLAAAAAAALHILRASRAALRQPKEGNNVHTVIYTQTEGGGSGYPPTVGVCHRGAHCEEEEGGGGVMWCNFKCTQNNWILINKIWNCM